MQNKTNLINSGQLLSLINNIDCKESYSKNPFPILIEKGRILVKDQDAPEKLLKKLQKANTLLIETLEKLGENSVVTVDQVDHTMIVVAERQKDVTSHTMIYDPFWKVLPKLNKAGIALLSYIGTKIIFNREFVMFDDKELEAYGIKTYNYYKGLNDLINNKVVAKSSYGPYIYWINVCYLFKGDRYRLYKNRIRESHAK